ncbi:FMN phosphatase YigB (HAD superfamily) [Rhizobium sp. SG_E_25_P2]|nr:FMN phosphatase YigB (HAD superfamily) [Rhizobium sp. SG_E_25_P2]
MNMAHEDESGGSDEKQTTPRKFLFLPYSEVSTLLDEGFLDPAFFRRRYNLSLSDEEVLDHFKWNSSGDARSYSAKMNVRAYLDAYPDVEESGVSPILHYIRHGRKNGYDIVAHPESEQQGSMPLRLGDKGLKRLISAGQIDASYYRARYGAEISDKEVIRHFLNRSTYDGRSYSDKFDAIGYLRSNPDVIAEEYSPLWHYAAYGKDQERAIDAKWRDFSWIPEDVEYVAPDIPCEATESPTIAIHLHIFYRDYLNRFLALLSNVRFEFDLLISTPFEDIEDASHAFYDLPNVRRVDCRVGENRGRNFGPFLVDFREDLQDYDFVLHLHSKKSLYSGDEQAGWASFAQTFLLGDHHVVYRHLQIMRADPTIGLLALTPFYKLPHWANHTLKNRDTVRDLAGRLDFEPELGFHSYPVGGMFWMRPSAMKAMLEYPWSYSDFPAEDGQTDGALQHSLERCTGSICRAGGSNVLYYEPWSNRYALNRYDELAVYKKESKASLVRLAPHFEVVSSDVFDTLVYRRSMDVEIGKRAVGLRLVNEGLIDSIDNFVTLRNKTELELRVAGNFVGDVELEQVYRRLAIILDAGHLDLEEFCDLEFEADLADQRPRLAVVDALNEIGRRTRLIFTSDSYYSKEQIRRLIARAGIHAPHEIFVSSALQARKDNGRIWAHIARILDVERDRILHIGDNIVSDIQIATENGLATFIVMHPMDKFGACMDRGIDLDAFSAPMRAHWLRMAEAIGCDPFFEHGTMIHVD